MISKIKKFAFLGWVFFMPFVLPNLLAAQTVIDQSFTSTPNLLHAGINNCCAFVAQTFTAGLTGTLAGVNIDVFSDSPFPLHVAIHTVTSSGEPSSTILGNTTLSSNSAPLSFLITFPQVINIVAGVQYAIVVNYEGAPPPGPGQEQGNWVGSTGNYYTGGDLYFSVDGSSWFLDSLGDNDVHFQTYVTANITLSVDIKPGSFPNSINLKSKGNVPVAILSSPTFDAATVDWGTVVFAGAPALSIGGSPEDVNGDGLLDLVLHFSTQSLNLESGDIEACLTGKTLSEQEIKGCDSVSIVK